MRRRNSSPIHQQRIVSYENIPRRVLTHQGSSRTISLVHKEHTVAMPVPAVLHEVAERISRDLMGNLSGAGGEDDWQSCLRDPQSELVLVACFLRFILDMLPFAYSLAVSASASSGESDIDDMTQLQQAPLSMLHVVLLFFHSRFVHKRGMHSATRDIASREVREEVIRSYFEGSALLKQHKLVFSEELLADAPPALVEAAQVHRAVIFGCFGGQGLGKSYFEELAHVVHVYGAVCSDFLLQMATSLLTHARTTEANVEGLYEKGLDVLAWLRQPGAVPSEEYLRSAPVSLPLIALLQLTNYVVFLRVSGLTADAGRRLFGGLSGHSQGVVSAIVVASSADEKQLFSNAERAIGLLFWLGLRSQTAFNPVQLMRPQVFEDSLAHNEGTPSPMLSISGLPRAKVELFVQEANKLLPAERQLCLSLVNGPRNVVVTGHPLSLYGLRTRLRKEEAPPSNQNRVPFTLRKQKFSARYLSVSVAFHNESYLEGVSDLIVQDAERFGLLLDPALIETPVFSTFDGSNLATEHTRKRFSPIDPTQAASRLFTKEVADLILTRPVDWMKATSGLYDGGFSHVVDFGPGLAFGIGYQTAANVEGQGVQVILAGALEASGMMHGQTELFDSDRFSIQFADDWAQRFAPSVMVTANGSKRLDTRLTRLLGKPHIICPGMTPTTSRSSFCSAVLSSGFHVELAGGGQHSEEMFLSAVEDIVAHMRPGDSFGVNILYVNQRQFSWQFPLILRLCKEGIPICGVTIGAGVPSPEAAAEICSKMSEAGLRYLALKPSGEQSILSVIGIAKAHSNLANFYFMLQWTGGCAGGHHSFEDLHAPILKTYGKIRCCDNLSLVIGGGFGDAEHTLKYMTGEWSTPFEYPKMPFDGLLMGSRLMVSEEASGHLACKQAIIEAPGVDYLDWDSADNKQVGGVISVISEMGEPIHMVATRGVLLWRELDKTIFSIKDTAARLAALKKRKDEIISRLNADYQRVWFGVRPDGEPCDLLHMSYRAISERLVELMYVKHQERWIDPSYQALVADWLWRVEERFSSSTSLSQLQVVEDLPQSMERFLSCFPESSTQVVSAEDALYFYSLVSRRGQKPVPFIANLAGNFETVFKKDSLWQSEDLESVVGCDPQRVCILQGPVAAAFSKAVEPVADILMGISESHYQSIGIAESPRKPPPVSATKSFARVYKLSEDEAELPAAGQWLERLVADQCDWMESLRLPHIVRGKRLTTNPIRSMLLPRPGITVEISRDGLVLSLYDPRVVGSTAAAVVVAYEAKQSLVCVTLNHRVVGEQLIPLQLFFWLVPDDERLHERFEGRSDSVLEFYRQLWLGEASSTPSYTINMHTVGLFCRSLNIQFTPSTSAAAPLDFAIVIAWESMIDSLLPAIHGTDPLRLLHLRNKFESQPGGPHFFVGDVCHIESQCRTIKVVKGLGKSIMVKSVISKCGQVVVTVVSEFLVRGIFTDYESCFELMDDIVYSLHLDSSASVALLKSKPYFKLMEETKELIQPGVDLKFSLATETRGIQDGMTSSISTKGVISTVTSANEVVQVGVVDYEHRGRALGNVVTAFLERYTKQRTGTVMFDVAHSFLEDHVIWAPPSGRAYSAGSSDWNPIHTNPFFSILAGNDSPILHGMWASAACRQLVKIFASENQPGRIRAWESEFLDVVLPGSELTVTLEHVGMDSGALLVQCVMRSQGRPVLKAMAQVEQAPTAYVFTGQGSQHVGMGMELYETSAVARAVWETADEHFRASYGISLLDIVRNNPKERTIHFGGRKGASIRANYMSMTTHDSMGNCIPLFPSITSRVDRFSFSHPQGLLFATQFTQPALVIMEKAIVADLRDRGLIQAGAPFAGHSLGEYASLTAIGNVLPTEELVDIVFFRGLTMRSCVPRDALGRSEYGMVAVNPVRIAPGFGHDVLLILFGVISQCNGDELLQCVNFNVENWQYVVAGHLRCLDALMHTLDMIYSKRAELLPRFKTVTSVQAGKDLLVPIVEASLKKSVRMCSVVQDIELKRGRATIPIPGLDVPFHSTLLRPGVSSFREYLMAKIKPSFINVGLLEGSYLPNVVGGPPFSLTKAYVELVQKATSSSILSQLLQDWSEDEMTAEEKQNLGHVLTIELLSYQFASPVRWIETQDYLFRDCGVERLIEIGPQGTLTRMAQRTLKLKYEKFDEALSFQRKQLSFAMNREEIYYTKSAKIAKEKDEEKVVEVTSNPPQSVAPVTPVVAVAAAAHPLDPDVLIQCLVGKKLSIDPEKVSMSSSLRDLSAGRSALQNELLGDLQKEFPSLSNVDGAEEKPLSDISTAVEAQFSPNKMGPSSSKMVRQLVQRLPGGFNARDHLASRGIVDAASQNRVLLRVAASPPKSRLQTTAEAEQLFQRWGSASPLSTTPQVGRPAEGPTSSAMADASWSTLLFLRVLMSIKLQLPLSKIPVNQSIRTLSNGRSAFLNEVISDLIREFGSDSLPDGAADLPLSEFSERLHASAPGKWTEQNVSRMYRAKLPFGVDASRKYLNSKSVPAGQQQRVLLYSLLFEPKNRITEEDEARQWLDQVVEKYCTAEKVPLVQVSSSASTAHGSGVMSGDLLLLRLRQDTVLRAQMETLAKFLDLDLREGHRLKESALKSKEQLEDALGLWQLEHGEFYERALVPKFSAKKARKFSSWWNWVRQDGMTLMRDLIFGRLKELDRDLLSHARHVINRSTIEGIQHISWEIERCKKIDDPNYQRVFTFGTLLLETSRAALRDPAVFKDLHFPSAPRTTVTSTGNVIYEEVPRPGERKLPDYVQEMKKLGSNGQPLLFMKTLKGEYDADRTSAYLEGLEEMAKLGVTFQHKQVLITGAGEGSIGAGILQALISGGAQVVVTTSNFSKAVTDRFNAIFASYGCKDSKLLVVPWNGISTQDVDSLVAYIYEDLEWDLDIFLPFAAISENGRDITRIDSRSEAAHRLMLTNVIRLLGAIKQRKEALRILTRPLHTVLPLSPNHGMFGADGLYAESKLGLEGLLNKWYSESWENYVSLAGAVIGWTRGTGLMDDNNVVAESVEKLGIRTFSVQEMAFNILALVLPGVVSSCQSHGPLIADLGGGLNALEDLGDQLKAARLALQLEAEERKLITQDAMLEKQVLVGAPVPQRQVNPRANLTFEFPELPDWSSPELVALRARGLEELINLDRVVVITGMGEVSPYGNSRTRWEMEAQGEFSLEACVELAWMMGLIVHKENEGWCDSLSGSPVKDVDIKSRYEQRILSGTGIRFIDPETVPGYDPSKKAMLQGVSLLQDMPPFQVSAEEGERFLLEHADKVDVYREGDEYYARLRKGAILYVPKAMQFDRLVAGLLPSGWNAERYGVPHEIAAAVDPITLYTLVSTMEALVSSGICDPFEIYQYVHVSELGNSMGSGQGGMRAQQSIYRGRLLEDPVQSDILQENFINTPAAWVNLLLLSSSGPIKTPVGACATAVESVEIGVETILSGKARIMVVGGVDDFVEEGSFEFAQMDATSNTVEELEQGREPREMSRPTTSTRGGFVEAQGSGTQILMQASLAFQLGVPIYGIVALASTATDRQGRSVPAPGQGILTTARESAPSAASERLMEMEYRKTQVALEREFVASWVRSELLYLGRSGRTTDSDVKYVEEEAARRLMDSKRKWGMDFYLGRPEISPLRGALATYGLTVDDISVASFHGTSTKLNDVNESEVLHSQLKHLKRQAGNSIPVVCQKYLTGHPKGAAAAWMLNGCVQMLLSGIVPGNRNADDIDEKLRQFSDYLYFPSRSEQTDGVSAALLKSFGFGQVGGELLILHPKYLLALLDCADYETYARKREERQRAAYSHHHKSLVGLEPFFVAKSDAPYSKEDQQKVYLNPLARATFQKEEGSWAFREVAQQQAQEIAAAETSVDGVGVDVQLLSEINISNQNFLERNFTPTEIAYCRSRPDPLASFAGRWCAKEAVVKALCSVGDSSGATLGAAAPLIGIAIEAAQGGAPVVKLTGDAEQRAQSLGVSTLKVTISHSGEYAMAVAIVTKKSE